MSIKDGPKIITDGLVLALDAGNRFSYPGSGTTWNDISGNGNNGILTNGPTFDSGNAGSIILDGADDYCQLSGTGIDVGVNFTIQTWVKVGRFGGFNSGWNRGSIITNGYPYSSNQGFWICCTSQGTSGQGYAPTPGRETFFISTGNDQYGATATPGTLTPYVNDWFNIAVKVNSTNPVGLYVNGQEVTYSSQKNGPPSLTYSSRPCSLGVRDNNNQEFLSGSIAVFGIYDRALNSEEITQNYNATKTRFGL